MKNFGRYCNTRPIEFERNTVIFGFNGMGKSTLSAIFYSLANREKDMLITNRTRLKKNEADEKQEVYIEVETKSDNHIFNHGTWNKRLENYTFNGEYVQDNVLVSSITKRAGTYSVELDKDIIKLDFKKQELVNKIEKNVLLKVNEVFLQYNDLIKSIASTGNAKSVKRNSPNIKKLSNIVLFPKAQKEVVEKTLNDINIYDKQLKKLEEIKTIFEKIPAVYFNPIDIKSLQKTLAMKPSITPEDISNHMKKYFNKVNPNWLIQGYWLSNDIKRCPFCGQELLDNEAKKIIKSIQAFAIRKSNKRIKTIQDNTITFLRRIDPKSICDAFDIYKDIIDQMANNNQLNKNRYEYFSKVTKDYLNDVLVKLVNKLELKIDQPFNIFIIKEDEIKSLRKINLLFQRISDLKEYMKQYELKLSSQKIKDKNLLKTKCLYDLSFGDGRVDLEEMIKNASDIMKCENEIIEIEKTQVDMRERIHLKNISKELKELNAKFSILKENGRFYIKLKDFDEKVEYNKNADERSKYILSEGDQRALAFAYFLFELSQDTSGSKKIIIFDDPISSLDLNRKSIIAYKISELMKDKSNQTIVLSHDISFIEKLKHFHNSAKYYVLTNTDDVVDDLKIENYILSDEEIYNSFIQEASLDNTHSNIMIALMSLRPLYEIKQKAVLGSSYYKFSTYFNHSIYSKVKNYRFIPTRYNIKRMRAYFKYVAKRVGIKLDSKQIIQDEFLFNGWDYEEAIKLYESINGDDIMIARKKALLIRLLLEVLIVKLSGDSNLKANRIAKDYNRILKKLRKGSEENKYVKKIIEVYNQTKKFHHGTDSGSMLGLSWINPDEFEYYDEIVKEIINYIKSREVTSITA